jgi:2,4-dienoyl-CoA reductase-like NADH-dependent reductase (Old Yellow Enzyme family)
MPGTNANTRASEIQCAATDLTIEAGPVRSREISSIQARLRRMTDQRVDTATSSALQDSLFSPFTVGSLRLPNRIVMAPMTRSRSPEGIPGEDVAAYYQRRSEAGVGLIITEGTAIDRPGALDDPQVPDFHGEAAIAGWRRVLEGVHRAGGRIMPQLWHVGATTSRRSRWTEDDPRVEGPSGLNAPGVPLGRAMTDADVADTIAAYGKAAALAEALGFDGVEVHGAHGYLIDQFFWSGTNLRTDAYGGASIVDRSRFAVEIVQAIRREVSADFPLSFRFSQFKQQDYTVKLATNPQELEQWLGPLSDAGVDLFHASQRRFWEPEFEGSDLNLAAWAKKVTGKASITVGSVGLGGEFLANWKGEVAQPTSIDTVLERLGRGDFDLVAVGRALLNDHAWAEKIAQHRGDELKPFDIGALKVLY